MGVLIGRERNSLPAPRRNNHIPEVRKMVDKTNKPESANGQVKRLVILPTSDTMLAWELNQQASRLVEPHSKCVQ